MRFDAAASVKAPVAVGLPVLRGETYADEIGINKKQKIKDRKVSQMGVKEKMWWTQKRPNAQGNNTTN